MDIIAYPCLVKYIVHLLYEQKMLEKLIGIFQLTKLHINFTTSYLKACVFLKGGKFDYMLLPGSHIITHI